MPASSSFETLVHDLLERELARLAPPLGSAGERRARAELERFLRERARTRTDADWLGLPSAELDEALARALQAGGRGRENVGQVLDGKYELEEWLAEGGFGQVYRARDRDLDCAVAIKVLKPVEPGSPEQLEAFKQEARRLTRLQHPNIVEWKTLNQTADGRLYLVMEYLEGEVLEDTLQRETKLAPARAARILLGVLDALRHAHELPDGSSLLHLDLKPSNVFLVRGRGGAERVKVLDFGISRFVGQEERVPSGAAFDPSSLGETSRAPGAERSAPGLACTPLYCAPEQAARILGASTSELDGRADLYSLGVVAYRMLAGRFPFEPAASFFEMLRLHREAPPIPLASVERDVPKRLARFVERCLAKRPEERFANAQAAHDELAHIVAPARSRVWLGIAALGLVGASLYGALMPSAPRPSLAVERNDEPVADRTLFFGPEQPAQTLTLVDLAPGTELTRLALVREPRAGAPSPQGWELHAAGDRRVEIRATASGARQERVFLAFEDGAGARFSEPFRLRYVEPADCAFESADVVGRTGRSVAPRGQVLELVARGPADVLPASVEATVGEEHRAARRDEARSTAERSIYRLSLDELHWAPGKNEIGLRLVDAAGNARTMRAELEVVDAPLALENCALATGTLAGGRWYVLAGDELALTARCSRPARLSWRVESSGGRTLASGASDTLAREHRLALDGATWATGSLAGTLRITADEREAVAYAPDSIAGVAETSLAFEVRPTGAEFDVSLTGARERGEKESKEPVRYVAAASIEAAVMRDHDVPMVVRAHCTPVDGPEDGSSAELLFGAPQELRKTATLALARDGLYRMALEARRIDPEGHPFAAADARHELLVVRDTAAPEIVLEGVAEVVRSRDELARLALPLRVEDRGWTSDPAPIEVSWTLEQERVGGPSTSSSGNLTLAPGEPFSFTPTLPPEDPAWPGPDGAYALRLRARDFAGNVDLEGREQRWTVSTDGPRLRVLAPADGDPWARSDQRFAVELIADDANGVAAVTCVLADLRGELPALTLTLVAGSARGHWQGSFALDSRWAGREVELRFRGTDAAGTETLVPMATRCTVGPIPNLVPAYVEVSYRGRGATRMRRVPGNHAATYFFGGRGDSIENATFHAAGLADFARSALTSSLRIEIPVDALADFYLDECEVSVAQYLAFVRAADGYADASLWDERPDETRRAELERALAAATPDLPASGISFDEARAFARWTGRELPTYLHWEYAVRGLQARPCSFSGATPGEGELNVATDGAWPVTRGADRTLDTGLVDLCSNVAEWTGTPARGRLSELRPAELLAPGLVRPEERLYVAGGSFARATFHFGVIARESRSLRSPSVGFRCMLPARVVEAAFLEAGDQRVVPVR